MNSCFVTSLEEAQGHLTGIDQYSLVVSIIIFSSKHIGL